MSLEKTLDRIATALETIAKGMTEVSAAAPTPAPQPAPTPAPQPAPTPAPAPVAPVPQPAPAAQQNHPFGSHDDMQKYVKESYEALEKVQAGKGTKIITILQEMQVPSVKEVKPEQYEDLYSKIEALRAG